MDYSSFDAFLWREYMVLGLWRAMAGYGCICISNILHYLWCCSLRLWTSNGSNSGEFCTMERVIKRTVVDHIRQIVNQESSGGTADSQVSRWPYAVTSLDALCTLYQVCSDSAVQSTELRFIVNSFGQPVQMSAVFQGSASAWIALFSLVCCDAQQTAPL